MLDPRAMAEQEHRRTLRLTPRWTPLKHNIYQAAYFWHPAPIKINPSGRRSGKTELGKRKAVRELIRKRDWPAKILCGAPTHDQAKGIFWEDIKALIPPHWKLRTNESLLEVTTIWGATIRVTGLDKPQRLEGVPWDWMLLDEIADARKGAFTLNLQPALATVGRQIAADLIGVPDEVGRNQAEYEALWRLGLKWRPGEPIPGPNGKMPWDPAICSFHWGSDQILEPEKLAALRSRMSKQQYEQEMCGLFIRSGGKVLPDFDAAPGGLHVRENLRYDPKLPLDWSLDFGVSPGASIIGQQRGQYATVLDEIVIETGADAPGQVRKFLETCRTRGFSTNRVRIFGDASGRHPHSPIAASDYEVIRIFLEANGVFAEFHNLDNNPAVKDTVNSCRMATMDANGVVHLAIDARCERLIADCDAAPWPDPSPKHPLGSYHWLAGLRYWLFGLGFRDTYEVTPLLLGNLGKARASA